MVFSIHCDSALRGGGISVRNAARRMSAINGMRYPVSVLRRKGRAKMDWMLGTSLLGPLEITKWLLVAFFVASTVGVIVGVYWEGEGFAKDKQHRGWQVLLASLAAETAFS